VSPFRRALVVFLKAPVPGLVKTRLTPVLTAEEAAGFYRALARDTMAAVREWADLSEGHRPWGAYQSHPRFPDLRWAGHPVPFFEQEGANLGDRLNHAFDRMFREDHRQTVVIGSDAPEITVDRLTEAFQSLDRHDAVIGPARDGGYYLLGLSHALLDVLDDIDGPEDVSALAHRLKEAGARCPHSRDALLKLNTGRIP